MLRGLLCNSECPSPSLALSRPLSPSLEETGDWMTHENMNLRPSLKFNRKSPSNVEQKCQNSDHSLPYVTYLLKEYQKQKSSKSNEEMQFVFVTESHPDLMSTSFVFWGRRLNIRIYWTSDFNVTSGYWTMVFMVKRNKHWLCKMETTSVKQTFWWSIHPDTLPLWSILYIHNSSRFLIDKIFFSAPTALRSVDCHTWVSKEEIMV